MQARSRTRGSPERLEARLWALEAKQQTTLELMSELKDQLKELRQERAQFRELEKKMMVNIKGLWLFSAPNTCYRIYHVEREIPALLYSYST